ncbi:hypothetical protein [Microbulbifer hydrolyticus]|uniref:Uncharacterized protein n=1 Tax=Microbulbifer hydrolyticus TaxID=48074 RepID=A0A6P1TA96_9GAMM|nr:hypothetical protein [Microbulbifer hydrolyticus]MBB5213296.1 hypothetical protein [Microbulbifer hydrolyticus]QHQ38583.1 hypothetical protein GTQ55_06015 [Microbulbifer hydrolyticus]
MNKFEEFVPELSKWNSGDGISLGNWITCIGRYDHFLGYLELVWPRFIVEDDTVFVDSLWDKSRFEYLALNRPKKSDIQKCLNIIDIAGLFLNAKEEVTDEFLLYLACAVRQAWEAKLKSDFPNRNFQVVMENFLEDPDDSELNVYFYEAEI